MISWLHNIKYTEDSFYHGHIIEVIQVSHLYVSIFMMEIYYQILEQ